MSTTTRVINGRIQNDPAHHSPHVDPAKPGDDRHQSEYEQKQYLKAHAREKNALMKQFCKLEGPSGNSEAFKRGWDLAFGTPEEKARAQAEIEAEKKTLEITASWTEDGEGDITPTGLEVTERCGEAGAVRGAQMDSLITTPRSGDDARIWQTDSINTRTP